MGTTGPSKHAGRRDASVAQLRCVHMTRNVRRCDEKPRVRARCKRDSTSSPPRWFSIASSTASGAPAARTAKRPAASYARQRSTLHAAVSTIVSLGWAAMRPTTAAAPPAAITFWRACETAGRRSRTSRGSVGVSGCCMQCEMQRESWSSRILLITGLAVERRERAPQAHPLRVALG